MIADTFARWKLPRPAILAAIGAAWIVALVAQLAGRGRSLHHDALLEGGLPVWAAFGLFVVAWQLMIAAMMLPSSLPLIVLFDRASARQPQAGRSRAAFLAAYALVWTTFGLIAFAGDIAVHAAVHRSAWLDANRFVISGGVLILAGAFQFSPLKDACLKACQHPASFLMRHYGRGPRAAFRLGRKHGLFCVGCCWALMLVSFAVGVANLLWMGVLTFLMVFEKSGPGGQRGVVPIGVGFLVLGAVVLLMPDLLPLGLS